MKNRKQSRRNFLTQSLAALAAIPACAAAAETETKVESKPRKAPPTYKARAVVAATVEGRDLLFVFTEDKNGTFAVELPDGFLRDIAENYEPIDLTAKEFLSVVNHKI